MIGVLVELIISWIILWVIAKKHLTVLGIAPNKQRLGHLGKGFLMAAICCIAYYAIQTLANGSSWTINRSMTIVGFFKSCWWVFVSVLFEELIFRGALLYLAIKKLGAVKASLLSAVCFGIYHWFSYNAFGNPVQMFFIFLATGVFGFMLAMAFAKTNSLYLPIGLHFGWNLLNIVLFSHGPLGKQLFINTGGHALQGIPSLLVFLFQVVALPLVAWWYFKGRK